VSLDIHLAKTSFMAYKCGYLAVHYPKIYI